MNLLNRRKLIWGLISGLIGIGVYIIYRILLCLPGIPYTVQYTAQILLLPLSFILSLLYESIPPRPYFILPSSLRHLLFIVFNSAYFFLLFNFIYFFLFGVLAESLYSKKGKIGVIITIFIYLSIGVIVHFIIIY